MKILRKLLRYLPTARGKMIDMEKDLLMFIDTSQEYELTIRNDLRNILSAFMQHIKETNGSPSKIKQKDNKDEIMFG